MNADERMVILGGEQSAPPEPPVRRRLGSLSILVAVGLVGVLVVTLVGSPEAPVVSTDPGGLAAPSDPPSAFVAESTTTLPEEVSPLAVGWRTVELIGGGWGVNALANGPDGWLAVSEGPGIVAHTSDNGVLWQARTIPDFSGFGAHAAVGDGVLAVVMSSVGYEGAPRAAVSTDGGRRWTPEEIDARPMTIDDVEVVAGLVHVFGAVGNEGSPAVWRRDPGGWSLLEDASASGYVGAVIEAPDGSTRAFGMMGGMATAWRVGPETLERVELEVPEPWNSVIEVASDGTGGYMGLASGGDSWIGNATVASTDLVSWTEQTQTSVRRLTGLPGGGFLAATDVDGALWASERGQDSIIPRVLPDADTGRQDIEIVTDLASDGALVAMVGTGSEGRAMLAVRSIVSQPLSVAVPSREKWEVTASLPAAGFAWVVEGGGSAALSDHSGAWLVDGIGEGVPTLEEWGQAQGVGGWPGGVWRMADGRLDLASSSGVESLPIEHVVETVGTIEGRLTVAWRDGLGGLFLETWSGDGWTPAGEPVEDVGYLYPLDSGFVADSFAAGVRRTVITVDGVTWTPIEGTLRGGNGVPFVTGSSDPRTVEILDRWPEVEEVELPTPEALTIVRHGEGFFVWAPGSVWVGDPDNGWARIPAGVENGVPGLPTLLAGDVPTLVTTSGDRLVLLQP